MRESGTLCPALFFEMFGNDKNILILQIFQKKEEYI